ncbi:Sec-independent protein translocase protein TatB [Falsirhodobacter sp. alg1]|uniref:Sec-independent protein translocase protein TatB n=1 Tax=Falsirhodobacter sp. alg1 TaxID=1472418 RepID=UPI0007879096|nr:Sec-independent protein translocase protein TatB [Falsirhodobacter sp. alg1]
MLDIGWSELILMGAVALIVVGPKDLPDMFRQIGRFTAKAKSMAREFSNAMEDAAKESGVQDVAKDLRNVTSAKSMGLDAVRNAATKFETWDPLKGSRNTPPKAVVEAEDVKHSAAAVSATPRVHETPPKPAPVVRARPDPVRRRPVTTPVEQRKKPVRRKPAPKKPE